MPEWYSKKTQWAIPPIVAVIMGSDSDMEKMKPCLEMLTAIGIPWMRTIGSCHRHPEDVDYYARILLEQGIKFVIVGAGMAADLAGALAVKLKCTGIQIYGVALSSKAFPSALDALLNIVRMPDVAVNCTGIDDSGAKNAVLCIAQAMIGAGWLEAEKLQKYYEEATQKKKFQPLVDFGGGAEKEPTTES